MLYKINLGMIMYVHFTHTKYSKCGRIIYNNDIQCSGLIAYKLCKIDCTYALKITKI